MSVPQETEDIGSCLDLLSRKFDLRWGRHFFNKVDAFSSTSSGEVCG